MANGAELAMIIRARDESSAVFAKVKSNAGGLADGIGKIGSGLALAGGAIGGIMAIGSAVASTAQSMISGNAQMETYQTQLTTMMGSADAAKERIAQLGKIGAETPFELTQLVAAEKIMMGFGLTTEKTQQLTGKSLDAYRTSMGDMAAGTGTDLSEITNLWAKFGSGATGESLARLQELGIVTKEQLAGVGIEFSKSGELLSPLPKAMSAAMKIADAKFGGGMKALSSTFEGQMSTLSDNFNQAKTVLMQPIFEVLKTGLTGLNEMLSSETFTTFVQSFAEQGAAFISTAIEIGTALASVFGGGGTVDDLMDVAMLLSNFLPMDVASEIVNVVNMLGGVFESVFAGDMPGAIDFLADAIEGMGQLIVEVVEEWASAFASWVSGADTGMMGELHGMAQNLMSWLLTSAIAIIEKLGVWAGAFLDWIGPMIPPMLEAMGGYIAAMWGWMGGTALPMIVSKLAEWGVALVAWVAPRIGPLLAALGGLLLALGGWLLGTALPAIVSQLLQWGDAFTAWVIPMIPLLIAQLVLLQIRLVGWIAEQVAGLATALVAWGVAFIAWIATDVIPALPDALAAILSAITGWIASTAGSLREGARSIGQAIIDGIAGGISAGVGAITSAARDAANSALEAAKSALGIESPSTVFRDQVGKMIPAGVIEGIGSMAAPLNASLNGLVQPSSVRPTTGGSVGVQQANGGTIVIFNGPVYGLADFEQQVMDVVGSGLRRGVGLGSR